MTAPLAEQVAAALGEHAQVSGFDEVDVWFKYACSLGCSLGGDSAETFRAHQADAVLRVVAAWLGSEWAMEVAAVTLATTNADTRRFRDMPDAAVYPLYAAEVLEALRADMCPGSPETAPGAPETPAGVSQDPDGANGRNGPIQST